MLSQEIRKKFLNYFKTKNHAIIPSSSVVPHDDPTILFTNAGMNQFKEVFLGRSKREYDKATSSQKCIRVGGKHNDLDNVGHTSRHLTFFEMLGNFSFGDYFKKEAITFAWDVTLEIFGFDPNKVWITVFQEDDEAFQLWERYVPSSRIVRMGEKENFWAMGDTGPCGPCSELLFDRGAAYGEAKSPVEDLSGERYLEFWNLVFMQYNKDAYSKMHLLPNQSIDTGAGIERVVSIKMGVDNVFRTDILAHLIAQIEQVTKHSYDEKNDQIAPAFHVIADHIRSLAFAISDGAQPSNIERGYVLRKLVRRSLRYARTFLGVEEPFLAKVLPALLETMGPDYHEIVTAKDRICEILTLEEESFLRTLKKGGNILQTIIEQARKNPKKQISGEEAFKLKDTYGFPLEEILLIAKDSSLQVNIDSYQLLEEKAKELSRSSRHVHLQEAKESLYVDFAKQHGATQFVGYKHERFDTKILAILHKGEFVESLSEGKEALLILKETPFYAEKGGQIADIGTISNAKAHFLVANCQNPYPNVIVHQGILENGVLNVGDSITAIIDLDRRQNICIHHTATHLLHWALQQVLGGHIRQAGSLVEQDRLRFDFNHHKALTPTDLHKIEDLVNDKIRENQTVDTYELTFEEVQNRPEIKQFFGDKYGAQVRVVDINYSKELCGGTHVYHVGMVGYFRIAKESSIAAGVRRIEAVAGKAAEQFVREEEGCLLQMANLLKTPPAKLEEKTAQLLEELSMLKSKIHELKELQYKQLALELTKTAKNHVITAIVEVELEDLQTLSEATLACLQSGVVALAVISPTKVQLVIKVSKDFVTKGVSAALLVKKIAPLIEGSGGGRPDTAQAGGKKQEALPQAFELIQQSVPV